MGTFAGTEVANSNLVFHYDMSNTQKSWKGKPVANYYGDMTTSSSLRPSVTKHYWDGYSWTVDNNYTHPGVEGPRGVFLGLIYKHTSGALNSTWSGNSYGYTLKDIVSVSGNTYTLSTWTYVSTNCDITQLPCTTEVATTNNVAVSGYSSTYNMSNKGTWQRIAVSAVSDGNVRWLPVYPSKNGVADGSFAGFYMWGAAQVEDGSTVSPYNGTNLLLDPQWSAWTIDGSGQASIGTRTIVGGNPYHCYINDVAQNTRQVIDITNGVYPGATYTFSVKYRKISGPATLRFQIQAWQDTTQLSTMSFVTSAVLGVVDTFDWQTIKITATTPANTNKIKWFMQDGDDYTTYTHSFELKDPCCEQYYVSDAVQFSAPNRSTTRAISDLTNNNTISSAVTALTYNSDGTFNFNGSTNYILAASDVYPTTTNAVTLDCWFKTGSSITSTYNFLIGKGTSDVDEEFSLGYNSTNIYFDVGIGSGPYASASYTLSANTAYNLVAVHSRTAGTSSLSIYLNGVSLSSVSYGATNTPNDNTYPISIGSRFYNSANATMNGSIYAVKIYNRALSSSEVSLNFNALRDRYNI